MPRISKINSRLGGTQSPPPTLKSMMLGFTILCTIIATGMILRRPQLPSEYYMDGSSTSFLRATDGLIQSIASATTPTFTMEEWRNKAVKECTDFVTNIKATKKEFNEEAMNEKEILEKSWMDRFSINENPSSTISQSQSQPYQRCQNVFIDLGTNIGDSIGYFVDNAIDVCSPIWASTNPQKTKFTTDFPRPHLDVTTLEMKYRNTKTNPLFGLLQKQANNIPSDTFCVYGMEGNPTFTERLTKLENYIMDMSPRPIRHLHIFTESVVTATDGPTKLFLDKTSVKENFWGSSILSSQQDAVKTAKELNDGSVVSADVMGISLSKMVQSTMVAYKDGASSDEKKDGLLIIKMDVEGAEYQVLKEAAASGVLCDYVKMGNRVVFVVEYHNMSITDATERRREKAGHQEAVDKMQKCGVEFEKLHAFWA